MYYVHVNTCIMHKYCWTALKQAIAGSSLTHSLTPSHSLTHSLTHSHTHTLTQNNHQQQQQQQQQQQGGTPCNGGHSHACDRLLCTQLWFYVGIPPCLLSHTHLNVVIQSSTDNLVTSIIVANWGNLGREGVSVCECVCEWVWVGGWVCECVSVWVSEWVRGSEWMSEWGASYSLF